MLFCHEVTLAVGILKSINKTKALILRDAPGASQDEGHIWLRVALGRLLVLLVVIDFGKLRVDDIVLFARLASCTTGVATTFTGSGAGLALLSLLVHRLAKLHGSLRERVGLRRDRFGVLGFERFLQIRHGVFDRLTFALADLGAMFAQCLVGGMDESITVILRLGERFAFLVILGVSLRVLDHLLDVRFRQPTATLDADLLLLTGRLVFRRDVDDTLGVHIQ